MLFSADAFGKFGALSHEEEWLDEARRYYINIVGKYGIPVQNVLKKLSAFDISVICPLHGPVLKDNLSYYINKYDAWSSYRPEEEGVLIAYASVYGNTAAAAGKLAEKISIKTEVFDLNRCDMSEVVAAAFKYSKLVLASVTYDGSVLPCAESFISKLKSKNFSNRTVGFIENGSWAPAAARVMRASFENFKNISFCNTAVTVKSAIDNDAEAQIERLAAELS